MEHAGETRERERWNTSESYVSMVSQILDSHQGKGQVQARQIDRERRERDGKIAFTLWEVGSDERIEPTWPWSWCWNSRIRLTKRSWARGEHLEEDEWGYEVGNGERNEEDGGQHGTQIEMKYVSNGASQNDLLTFFDRKWWKMTTSMITPSRHLSSASWTKAAIKGLRQSQTNRNERSPLNGLLWRDELEDACCRNNKNSAPEGSTSQGEGLVVVRTVRRCGNRKQKKRFRNFEDVYSYVEAHFSLDAYYHKCNTNQRLFRLYEVQPIRPSSPHEIQRATHQFIPQGRLQN